MESAELRCCVCDEYYSDNFVPRSLACGHSACSRCIDILIPISKSCPECRAPIAENNSSALPINYTLLRICRYVTHSNMDYRIMPELTFPIKVPSSEPKRDAGKCPIHGSPQFFMCLSCSVWACTDCVIQAHPDPPTGTCYILSVEDAILKIQNSHTKDINRYLKTHVERIRSTSKAYLENVEITLKNFTSISENTGKITQENLAILQRLKDDINKDLKLLDTFEGVLTDIREIISGTHSPDDIIRVMNNSYESQSSFEKFVDETNERIKEYPDIMSMILGEHKSIRELYNKNNVVFASKIIEGKEKWGQVKLIEEDLLMYSLGDVAPTEECTILPYCVVRPLINKEAAVIFFEITWGDMIRGIVKISLFGDTARGRQSILLCSGEKGPSYKNTCFFNMTKNEDKLCMLQGGDYQNNNGNGGVQIVDDITDNSESIYEITAGLFTGWSKDDRHRSCTFNIYLDDFPYMYDTYAFGKVIQGLDILREAAAVAPITDVKVSNCGLVLS